MVIFAAIAMVIVVVSGFFFLWSTDFAEQDPSDRTLQIFGAAIAVAPPLAWTLLNVTLLLLRGQTGGQYVAGIKLVAGEGKPLGARQAWAWWIALNPLLFNWLYIPMMVGPLIIIALSLSPWVAFGVGFITLLCVAAPIAAFVSGAIDERNRGLHDRVAGTYAVPVDAP